MNYTQEEIIDALKATIETVPDIGIVITDSRFVEDEKEIIELVTDLNTDMEPTGMLISWKEIEQSQDEDACKVIAYYKYHLFFLMKYLHRRSDGLTSDRFFTRKIFELMEALNAARSLGLDNRVEHQLLQSSDEFGVVAWGEGHNAPITHMATFTLDVQVVNNY